MEVFLTINDLSQPQLLPPTTYHHRNPVCSFLVFWIQIAIKPFPWFQHSVCDYMIYCDEIGDLYAERTYVSELRVRFRENKTGLFGSIIYNRAILYKRQKFLKLVADVIIIDQCNQTAR